MTTTASSLPTLIERQKSAFALALGGSSPAIRAERAEKFARICLTTIRTNPALQQCKPESVLGALMTSAQLGLEPGTPLGYAYLVPYGQECTFQLGYKGLLQLLYRSDTIASFNSDVVYRQEIAAGLFTYSSGINPTIHHQIDLISNVRSGRSEDIVAAYAAVTLKNGQPIVRLVTRDELDKAARLSGGKYGPSKVWKDHYQAMAIKTAIKRLAAWLPTSAFTDAVQREDESMINAGVYSQQPAPVQEQEQFISDQPVGSGADALNDMLSGQAVDATVVEEKGEQHG